LSYFESRLKVDFQDNHEIAEKLSICRQLGIKNVILEPKTKFLEYQEQINEILENHTYINIFLRCNIEADSLKRLKNSLKDFMNSSYIVSVESSNKEVQLFAAKDSRIDIVSFSKQEVLKTITPGVISLVKQNNSFIEFSLAPLMEKNMQIQSRNLRNLYKAINLVLKYKCLFILSGNFKEACHLRHPRGLLSVVHTLLDVPENKAKNAFSSNVKSLLDRVKFRNENQNVENGIKII